MDFLINADRVWIKDLEYVFKYGNRVSPRGMLVYESIAYMSTVSMKNPVILNKHRKLGYKFMAAEAAWILSGDDRVATISRYSKDIANFSDNGSTFFGAYGPKIKDQIDYVVSNLHNDINSRQAVINIWRENPPPTKDVPCTLSLQFLVRHDIIHCVASMRSSDLWLGHPYDIVNFSAVAFAIMLQLNNMDHQLSLGNLFLTAGSKHIYERNGADVQMVLEEFEDDGVLAGYSRPLFDESKYDDANEFLMDLWDCANSGQGLLTMFRE